ncbi:MAG: DinB family protein [Gemmatimonadetes bacterium]|nr:MAG: DinB family protein [Gemmatimonadota bacterium]PYO78678.1 MAG: DinB family protein [Gemmatimonadota bacterium]
MRPADVILLNAREVRRRSEIAWRGIPADSLQWKPDPAARSAIEMVRHVLEGEYLYMQMAKERRSVSEDRSPFAGRPFVSVDDELAFAVPFRKEFERMVGSFADDDFESIVIDRSDVGYKRQLGDFLLRAIYHEAVHCGQLLGYLRTIGVARPNVWD